MKKTIFTLSVILGFAFTGCMNDEAPPILQDTNNPVDSTAQSGKIVGTITDGDYNEPMSFANVLIKNTTPGTTSNFDGTYQLEISEGIYILVFVYLNVITFNKLS